MAGFAVMFFIIFFAYAQLGFLAFGWSNPEFKTFGDSWSVHFNSASAVAFP